jgi:hypothetical protein
MIGHEYSVCVVEMERGLLPLCVLFIPIFIFECALWAVIILQKQNIKLYSALTLGTLS